MIARERCGGSLITRDTIISAAHCFLRYGEGDILLMPEFVEVTLGEHNIASISPTKIERIYRISNTNIEIHPLYNPDTLENDIAKLYLDTPVNLVKNPKILPICLPAKPYEDYSGRDAKATGWGIMKRYTPAEVLQEINIQIISLGECKERLSNFHKGRAHLHLPTENMLCAKGNRPKLGDIPRICRGTCLISRNLKYSIRIIGDSGGPLTVEQRLTADDFGPIRRELVGVVSAVGAFSCQQDVPDKYTDVTKYLDWIRMPRN